ncbi:MAG: ATP-binding protein, partial [Nitrospirae bacterium]|nr:ATP-binding protein [Nitrospirota bacterium]
MDCKELFLNNNPFIKNSVGEADVWTDASEPVADIETINKEAFDKICDDIKNIKDNPSHKSRVRFIVGNTGMGKSHLFLRVINQLKGKAFISFTANPPRDASAIKRAILKNVVNGLSHPFFKEGRPCEYSQLRYMLYRWILQKQDVIHEFHNSLVKDKDENAETFYMVAEKKFSKISNISRAILKIIPKALNRSTEDLALEWLGGATSQTDAELKLLGVNDSLQDGEVSEVFKLLGRLAPKQMPMALILDQLDLMDEPQIKEFESLIIDLIDSSSQWYILISLLPNKYDIWINAFSDPTRSRIEAMGAMPVCHLKPVETQKDKSMLIRKRLASPSLCEIRMKCGIKNDIYPLSEEIVKGLCDSAPITPRRLLINAAAAYDKSLKSPTRKRPLNKYISVIYADEALKIERDNPDINTYETAERITDLIDILSASHNISASFINGELMKDKGF